MKDKDSNIKIFPCEMINTYNERKKLLDKYLKCILSHNSDIDILIRLKLGFIIESLNEKNTLEELNNVLKNYVNIFLNMGIELKVNDFNYSTITRKYMNSFFSSEEKNINLEYNNLIKDIKCSLKDIVYRYSNDLNSSLLLKVDEEVQTLPASNLNLYDDYLEYKYKFKLDYFSYLYNNSRIKLNNNLDDKDLFIKFYSTYFNLNINEKNNINSFFVSCFNEIEVLIDYYRYRFILDYFDEENTIYNLFYKTLESFYFIKEKFDNHFINEVDYNFYSEFNRYINFIYSSNNKFIKDNYCNCDVSKLLLDKYNDLGFKFTEFDFKDNVFTTYDILKNIVYYVLQTSSKI